MNEPTRPTKQDLIKLARVGALHRAARTITEMYRADRESVENKDERYLVFRQYALALLQEQTPRIELNIGEFARLDREKLGGRIRLKRSRRALAEDIVLRFEPAWAAMSDAELLELEEALIRARETRRI